MIYAVHVSDPTSGLEKVVTVDAQTPEDAFRRIEKVGCRIVRVSPAPPGVAAGVVTNPPTAAPASETAPSETPDTVGRRDRDAVRAAMVHRHNLLTLWPILVGVGSILWGLIQWQIGNDRQALFSAVVGVILSAVGALRRWTRDQGPWR